MSRTSVRVFLLLVLLGQPLVLLGQSDVYIVTQNTDSFSVDVTAGDALVGTDGTTTTTIYSNQTVSNGVRVALDLPNNRAFIMDNAGSSTNDKIFRVDLPSGTLTEIYQTVSPYDSIGDIEYDAANERLYFTEYQAFSPEDALSYLDVGGSNARTAVLTDFANIPVWLALDIANNRVFINDTGDDIIYRVDLPAGTKTALLSSVANSYDIEWAPNSGRLYFVENTFLGSGTDRLAYIGATGGTPTVIDSSRGYINSFAVDENAGFAYAIGSGTETVYQVNLSNGSSSTFYTGSQAQNPQGMAVSSTAPNSPPSFNDGPSTTLNVDENASATAINSLLDITDTDSGDPLTWSATSGPSNGSLGGFPDTDTSNGGIVTPGGLTYTPSSNTVGSDSFDIQISDGTDTDSITVNVTINDVNPIIVDNDTGTIAEDQTSGTVVDLDATDDTNGLTWSLAGGTPFTIDPSTGVISPNGSLDFETQSTYNLSVSVDDEDADTTADDTETITVNVTDVAPAVGDQTVGPVSETAGNGTVVGTVATTQDTPTGFSITGGDPGGAFAIDNSGQITVADTSAIDFEATTSFSLTIQVTDGTNTDSGTITINVTDAGPAVANQTVGPVSETAANSAVVGTVATTQDTPTGFAITGGDPGGAFAIDNSGQITVADATAIDFETANSFNLTVEATDGSNNDSGAITINVTDVDETPTFTASGPFTVNDSATATDAVGNVDANVGGTADTGVTYTITAGNDDVASDGGGAFAIDANSGEITVADADDIDATLQASFTLTVEASEGSQGQTSSVTIDVLDDIAPAISGAILPSVSTITDTQVGIDGFSLSIDFNEAMDTNVDPTVSFPTPGEDPTAVGNTVASLQNASGQWTDSDTYVVTYDVADDDIVINDIDVQVTSAQDAAGNTMSPTTRNDIFTVLTAPAPSIQSITSPSGNGTFGVGDAVNVTVTFDEAVDFTANGGTLQLSLSNGETVTLANADAVNQTAFAGTYTIQEGDTDSVDLNVSAVNLTGGATLAANDDGVPADTSPPAGQNLADTQDIAVDANTPAASMPDLTAATDTGDSDTDNLTNNPTPTITGTTEAGATVDVRVGGASVGTTTADSTGAWSFTFGAGELSEGANTVDIIASDAVNTSADSPDLTITLDTAAPTLSAVDLVAASDTGDSNTDDLTADATPTIEFTAEIGATVEVDWGDGNGFVTTATRTGGPQQETLGTPYATDGTKSVTVRATDAAGNQTTQSLAITIDTTAPTPALSSVTGPTDQDPFAVTIDFGEEVTGFIASDVTVGGPGGTVTGLTDDGGGVFTATVDAAADGMVTIDVAGGVAQDIAGNASAAATQLSVELDTTAPAAPSTPDLEAGSDTGGSDSDDITGNTTPTFVGTGETDATVTLFRDGNGNGTVDTGEELGTATVSGGTWSITSSPALAEGSYDIRAIQTDEAGNTSPASAILAITVDTTAPELSSIERQAPTEEVTNADTLTFRATFDTDVQNVDAADFSVTGTTATLAVATVTADTVFHLTISGGDLADLDGTVGIDLAAIQDIADAAGNALPGDEPATDEAYTVDNTAPTVTVDTLTTGDPTPPLTGTVDDNDATLELTVDGQTVTPTNNGDGTWTLADDTLSALADGTYDVVMTATDAAGNQGSDATTDELTVTPDTDGDGVADAVENAGPNGGDGNGDSTPDADQPGVASVPTATGRGYMTLTVAGGCTELQQVAAVDPASLPADPAGNPYPFGLVEFTLPCETATVDVVYHAARQGEFVTSTYRKYGPVTPGDPSTAEWYDFSDYASVTDNTWTLDLADNRLGDDTGDDGLIVDQGGPSQGPARAIPVDSPWALLLLMLASLALAGRSLPRTARQDGAA